MPTAFDALDDALFCDRNLAVDGSHADADGVVTACRVLIRAPDRAVGLLGSVAVTSAAVTAELRVSEVATVAEGDRLTVPSGAYRVAKSDHPDGDRRLWRLELEAAP